MKVSIIVSTYRRDKSLEKAIKSLIEQTYENIEILVVDDNADYEWNLKVKSIVDKFKNKNIIYIKNEINLGSANTRNRGIDFSSGDYITFLDDDDLYLSKKIENQLTYMLKNSGDYSITDLELFTENDVLIEKRRRGYIKYKDSNSLFRYHLKYHMTGTDTMMFKREYLMKIGKFDSIDIGDEFYLMKKAIESKGTFVYVPTCDVKAYVHMGENNLSSGESKIKGENLLYEYKKELFDRLKKNDIKYIKMRHYAVLAFAEIRRKKIYKFIEYSFKAFFSSPINCIKLIFDR